MSSRSNRKPETPLDRQRKALDAEASALKAKLEQTRKTKEELPALRAKAVEREQREIISRYHRPVNIEGPSDYRFELHGGREAKPRKLRKERSKAPLLTVVLLVTLVFVAYYAVRMMWNG